MGSVARSDRRLSPTGIATSPAASSSQSASVSDEPVANTTSIAPKISVRLVTSAPEADRASSAPGARSRSVAPASRR